MPAQNLSQLSKLPPVPNTTTCRGGVINSYTCHSAVLHWAYMDQGCTQQQANQRVTALTSACCQGCKTGGAHSSIPASLYGPMFYHVTQRIHRNQLHTHLNPGDILITGHYTQPNHSMIVRQVRGVNHVTVRGFNNIGTLGTGALLQYDPASHNITQNKYWPSPTMFGVNFGGIELYRVTYAHYSQQVALSMNMTF